jgi:hypothetical protein
LYDSLITLTCLPLLIFCTYFILSIFIHQKDLFLINKDTDKLYQVLIFIHFSTLLGYPQKPPSAGLPWRSRLQTGPEQPQQPRHLEQPPHLEQQVSPELQKGRKSRTFPAETIGRTSGRISGRNSRPTPHFRPHFRPPFGPEHSPDLHRHLCPDHVIHIIHVITSYSKQTANHFRVHFLKLIFLVVANFHARFSGRSSDPTLNFVKEELLAVKF